MAQTFETTKTSNKPTNKWVEQTLKAQNMFKKEEENRKAKKAYFKDYGADTCRDSRCPFFMKKGHRFDDHGECTNCGSTTGKCFAEKCKNKSIEQQKNDDAYFKEHGDATCTHKECPLYNDYKPHRFDGHGDCSNCGSTTGKCFAEKCTKLPVEEWAKIQEKKQKKASYFVKYGDASCKHKDCPLYNNYTPHPFDGHGKCTNCGSTTGKCFAEKCTKLPLEQWNKIQDKNKKNKNKNKNKNVKFQENYVQPSEKKRNQELEIEKKRNQELDIEKRAVEDELKRLVEMRKVNEQQPESNNEFSDSDTYEESVEQSESLTESVSQSDDSETITIRVSQKFLETLSNTELIKLIQQQSKIVI